MRVMRVVRLVDKLLELFIFDLLLATPARRRAVACLGSAAALVLYCVSGLLFVPKTPYHPEPLSSAPYIDDKTWVRPAEVVHGVTSDLELTPARAAALARELPRHEANLNRLVALLCESQAQPPFTSVPYLRTMREATNLLVARGLVLDASGSGGAALRDFVAALRLGRVLARGAARAPTLIEGVIATAMQRRAVEAMLKLVQKGRMTRAQKSRVRFELALRSAEGVRTLKDYMRGDRAEILGILDRAVAEAGLNCGGDDAQPLRLLLPLRRSDRAALLAGVRDDCARVFDHVISRIDANRLDQVTEPEIRRIVAGSGTEVETCATDSFHALFSRDTARKLISVSILSIALPNSTAAGKRMDTLEETVATLEACTHEIAP